MLGPLFSARRPLLVLAAAALVTGCGTLPKPARSVAPPLPTLEPLLAEQTDLYPLMTEEDLYKLISQATRGPAIPFTGDDSKLDTGLYAEVEQLKVPPARGEPMLEVLDPSRNLVRINLRPFLRSGGKVDDLARAVGETHRAFRGDRAVFEASLQGARDLLAEADLDVGFGADRFWKHALAMREKGYPPGVHSEEYALTYGPAYRIIRLDTLSDRDYGGRDPVPLLEGLPVTTGE